MMQDLDISEDVTLHTIEEALEDIKAGKLIIVVDDEDRENEGDFICAAEKITPELINFMATHGRGLICTPILEERAKELEIDLMVKSNTAMHNTAFTVSIDLIGHGCTTGISAYDRATGIKAMVDPNISAQDFARPGHIFPLIAKHGGVLRRTGHTEAAVDLARLCGFYPAGVLVEILNEDGTMARLPELLKLSKKLNIKIITIKDLVAYRMRNERLIKREMEADLHTEFGLFKVIAYKQINNGDIHLAIVRGNFNTQIPALVKVHSNSETGDILGMLFDGYSNKLIECLKLIDREDNGALLIMRHGDNSSSVLNKLKSIDADTSNNPITSEEQRDFGIGAQILSDLGISKIRLMSHHSKRRVGLVGYGLEIVENIDL